MAIKWPKMATRPLLATWSHNGDLTQKSKNVLSFPYRFLTMCRKPHQKIFKNEQVIDFSGRVILEKVHFEIMAKKWPKRRFLWDKMAILSPIGLKIGLPITLHMNGGQNKLEVCISKNMAKMAKIGSKMDSRPLLDNLGMAITRSPYI